MHEESLLLKLAGIGRSYPSDPNASTNAARTHRCGSGGEETTVVHREEQGWPGHFCSAEACWFRRNTLLTMDNKRIIISTVGEMVRDTGKIGKIGPARYYETKAFYASKRDCISGRDCWEADVTKKVHFDSPWEIEEPDKIHEANDMHECVVLEISRKMAKGEV